MEERREVLEKIVENVRSADINNFTVQSQSIYSMIDQHRHLATFAAAVMAFLAMTWSVLIGYGIKTSSSHD